MAKELVDRSLPNDAEQADWRSAGLAGIVFAVAFMGFLAIVTSVPNLKGVDGPARVTRFYASGGHRAMLVAGAYLAAVAALAFIAFAEGLGRRLTALGGVGSAGLLSGASRLTASAIGTGGACYGAIGSYLAFGLASQIDPQIGALIPSIGFFSVSVVAMLSAATVVLTTCRGVSGSAPPRWLRAMAYLAVVGCVAGIAVVPILLFVAWVVASSTWLIRSPR
ncbi:MAG: hypothetical protein M3N98_09325 [Actinomycetota bacterium]|nr:hypothetical protein [Actinomycetota bacterium]